MKILLANKYFYPKGGADVSFLETCDLLTKKGHKVIPFSTQNIKNLPSPYSRYFISDSPYDSKSITVSVRAALNLLYSFEAKRRIDELIEAEQPDIAHLNNIYHQISPSILHVLNRRNIPVVMTLRDYKLVCASYLMLSRGRPCELCRNERYYKCFLEKCVKGSRLKSLLNTMEMYLHHHILRIYDLVDIFIVPSAFMMNKLKEMGFNKKMVLLRNFVDVDEIKPQFYHDENSIVYFGRLAREKGIATLIDAVKEIRDVDLKIIGDGPLKKELEEKIRRENIFNVRFLGYMQGDDLRKEIRRLMFVVLPSEWYENYPRAVIEAFALGKPVLGSRMGGTPELVKDNETGLMFKTGNIDDLRSKLKELASDNNGLARMGRNARKFVEEELNPEAHYSKLMEIYEEARR